MYTILALVLNNVHYSCFSSLLRGRQVSGTWSWLVETTRTREEEKCQQTQYFLQQILCLFSYWVVISFYLYL